MNKKINELFSKALDEAVPETWTTLSPVQLSKLKEKFAELIIKECAEIANKAENSETWSEPVGDRLKKNFDLENPIMEEKDELPVIILNREYYGESISDIDHDISEMFEYGPKIPQDENGFHEGKFIVTVKWMKDD